MYLAVRQWLGNTWVFGNSEIVARIWMYNSEVADCTSCAFKCYNYHCFSLVSADCLYSL